MKKYVDVIVPLPIASQYTYSLPPNMWDSAEVGCRVVVPFGKQSERLCYEFSGEYDGSIFYAYIDARTGKQVELFKVIEGSEGSLLM